MTQAVQAQLDQTMPSLATIAEGAVEEAFQIALQEVSLNIADPNTDLNAKREINIKIVFAPIGEEREEVRIGIQCTTKTQSHKPIDSLFWLQPIGGMVGVTEMRRRQTTLADYNG